MERTQDKFVGKYFWLIERLSGARKTSWIINITGFGESIPQRVHGKLLNTATGEVTITDDGENEYTWEKKGIPCFSCEIGRYISLKELTDIKKEIISRIQMF